MPSDPLVAKKRGRPRKNAVNGAESTGGGVADITFADKRTDTEVINEVLERFNVLRKLSKGIAERKVRSMIVSGAPGIGKTYTLVKILETIAGLTEKAASEGGDVKAMRFKKVSGYMSPAELYRLLYEYRHDNDVLMLDDTDNVFYDADSRNMLKAALDTIPVRVLSYRVRNTVVDASEVSEDDDDGEVPNEFEFKGTVVFVTNIDFYAFLELGATKALAPHLEALMQRTQYLDMALHTPRAVTLWIKYMMEKQKMLLSPEYGMTQEQSDAILKFIVDNADMIRKPSLRTAVKLAELARLDPEDWQTIAKVTMRKPVKA